MTKEDLVDYLFFSTVSPSHSSPSLCDFMNAPHMLSKTLFACKALDTMCAWERLLSFVHPLMAFQALLHLEHLSAKLTFEFWLFVVVGNVAFKAANIAKSLATEFTVVLFICRVYEYLMFISFVVRFESLMACFTFKLLLVMLDLDMIS